MHFAEQSMQFGGILFHAGPNAPFSSHVATAAHIGTVTTNKVAIAAYTGNVTAYIRAATSLKIILTFHTVATTTIFTLSNLLR